MTDLEREQAKVREAIRLLMQTERCPMHYTMFVPQYDCKECKGWFYEYPAQCWEHFIEWLVDGGILKERLEQGSLVE